ncbi:hypothetical protein BWQ96_00860 [Gracilariopsis chorda]|uniref:Uncharacterized protein n=1 Tax=Gracilariopsis chorda TaxID=448386 RepID=A0A2V3J4A6_9FLOR|nr:hypothetical protein BWQ96_00860 [Gracilariopsis chorda]|eukprot:PXF49286.1 hypothetical protein BWQ96_00860 [Gracilariopsis chorda]
MRSVLSCQGFQINIGESDSEINSLCRHALPDDIWVHLHERASPHAIIAIGQLRLLDAQGEHLRRSSDGRRVLDLSLTIWEAAQLVKFLSDVREENISSIAYARADVLFINDANDGGDGTAYDVIAGSCVHKDDEIADMPGSVITTRVPRFHEVALDETKVFELLARSEKSGDGGTMDQERSVWKEVLLRKQAINRRDWYVRRVSADRGDLDEDSNDDSEQDMREIEDLETAERNGDQSDDQINEQDAVETNAPAPTLQKSTTEFQDVTENERMTEQSVLGKGAANKTEPTDKVEVEVVVDMKAEYDELRKAKAKENETAATETASRHEVSCETLPVPISQVSTESDDKDKKEQTKQTDGAKCNEQDSEAGLTSENRESQSEKNKTS